jgi:hypothetical protein
MPADVLLWLPLAVKLIATAAIVVGASVVAERVGALTGALIATLPVTIWPAYVFLSLDHDAAYIAQAALSGLVVNAATGLFLLIYAALAQKRGTFTSLTLAAACWIALALMARSIEWSFAAAALLNLLVYPACLWLGGKLRTAAMPQLRHAWYDLPLRTILVCALMASVIEAGHWAGPVLTGLLAVYPISSTSLILILHPRIGGRASGAVIANSVWSLFGISFMLAALNLAVVPLGAPMSLAAALAIPIVWNLTVWVVHRRATFAVRGGAA